MIFLVFAFFITAVLYASVGFGGGSTYNALLALQGTDYRILPAIALLCNIIVVIGGVWQFGSAGHFKLKRIAPFITTSIPFAWIGGRIHVSENIFLFLLGVSLLIAGAQMLFPERAETRVRTIEQPLWLGASIGGGLGFLSGLVGIGGGIFLAPILYFLRWDSPRVIAATCSFFILVNSISGLSGQLVKLNNMQMLDTVGTYWAVFPAVLIGGQIGSRIGALNIPEKRLKQITAILVLYVALRLLLKWWSITTTV